MTPIRLTHPESGDALGQRYIVLRQLREEPWGNVWLAQDRLLGVEVSLKIIPREDPAYNQARGVLMQEAVLAVKFRHPQALAVFYGGEAHEGFYLVQEPFPGETLLSYLGRHHRLAVPQALNLLEKVGEALAAAHSHGVVHQALDPVHVLIAGDDLRVANWTAKLEDTDQAGYLELKAYLPPEVIHGDPVTPGGNVFSLGVLGFRLLAGSLPYPLSFDEPFPYRLEGPPLDLEAIPVPLQNLLLQCLAREPEERLPDAGAFLTLLHQNRELWRATPPEKWFPWQADKTTRAKTTVKKATTFLEAALDKSRPHLATLWDKAKALPGILRQTLAQVKSSLNKFGPRLWWGVGLAGLAVMVIAAVYLLTSRPKAPPPGKPLPEPTALRLPAVGGPPLTAWSEPPAPPRTAPPLQPAAPAEVATPAGATASLPTPAGQRFWVLAASYRRQEHAQMLSDKLKKDNLKATVVKTTPKGQTLYLVKIGPVTGRAAADELARQLRTNLNLSPKVVPLSGGDGKPSVRRSNP